MHEQSSLASESPRLWHHLKRSDPPPHPPTRGIKLLIEKTQDAAHEPIRKHVRDLLVQHALIGHVREESSIAPFIAIVFLSQLPHTDLSYEQTVASVGTPDAIIVIDDRELLPHAERMYETAIAYYARAGLCFLDPHVLDLYLVTFLEKRLTQSTR